MSKLTQQELERHLWGAADILRGTVDAGDYKQYIFGLLFYKRLCDVWQEEFEALLAETGDRQEAADPDEHLPRRPAVVVLRQLDHRAVGDAGLGRLDRTERIEPGTGRGALRRRVPGRGR